MDNSRIKELIKSAVNEVDSQYIQDKADINNGLNAALTKKYTKVDRDIDKYTELLKYNIIYYKCIIKKLENIINLWIKSGVITNEKSVKLSFYNITNSSKAYVNEAMKNGVDKLSQKDMDIYHLYDRMEGIEKVEKVEKDYKTLNLYKDILYMVISVISKNPKKYNEILDYNYKDIRTIILKEIYSLIKVLIEDDENAYEKEEEAVLMREDGSVEADDYEKSISFRKYVSMMSAPEISVKINNVFRDILDSEEIDSEEAYLFTEKAKDYVSCAVLLMDFVADNIKYKIKTVFSLYATGSLTEQQFMKLMDMFVEEETFLDARVWMETLKRVKSDFNFENNNFFGNRTLESNMDVDLHALKKYIDSYTKDEPVAIYTESEEEVYEDEKDENSFAEKLKKGFSSFSEKLKSRDEGEEEYDEEDEEDSYEEHDEEYVEDINEEELDEYYEEEYVEEDEEEGKFKSRFKNLFKRRHEDEEEDEEYEDEEDDEDIEIKGDSDIQDREAVEILKMKEKAKRAEKVTDDTVDLTDEKELIDRINKAGASGFIADSDIVLSEEDFVYRKGDDAASHRDDIHSSKPEISSKQIENNADKKKQETEFTEKVTESPATERKQPEKIEPVKNNKEMPRRSDNSEGSVFEELEELKAMRTPKKIKTVEDTQKIKNKDENLEKTHIRMNVVDTTEEDYIAQGPIYVEVGNEDDTDYEYIGDKNFKYENAFEEDEDEEDIDELGATSLTKSKKIRDLIILLSLVVVIILAYSLMMNNFRKTEVKTNAPNKQVTTQTNGQNEKTEEESKTSEEGKNEKLNEETAKISQKTELEKEKDAAYAKANELSKEADQYKNGKGTYYTISIGATKSKDGAEAEALKFRNRGFTKVSVIRNGGYYMIKNGSYNTYNEALAVSRKFSALGVQNYVVSRNRYLDLKIESFKTIAPYLSAEQRTSDYNDLKNQISASGKDATYLINLRDVYNEINNSAMRN